MENAIKKALNLVDPTAWVGKVEGVIARNCIILVHNLQQKSEIEDRSYFLIRLPIHQAFLSSDNQITTYETTYEKEHYLIEKIVQLIEFNEKTALELMTELDITNRSYFAKNYLKPSLLAHMIEMTIPDKPKSRLQKYRLTQAGKQLLTRLTREAQ